MAKALLHFNTRLQKGIFFPFFLSFFQFHPIHNYTLLSFYHNTHFLSHDKSESGFFNPGGKDCNFDYTSASSRFDALLHTRPAPHISACNSFLNSLFKMKQYSTFIALSKKLELLRFLPDLYRLNMIIHCYCQLGRADLGLSVMGKLMKLGFQPDTVTFTHLVFGLCQNNGNVAVAVALFHEAVNQGCQLGEHTYNTLINRLCKVGRVDEGLKLLRMKRLAGIEPDVVSYTTVIHGLSKQKLMSEARQLFSEMINRGITPDAITYSTVIDGLCKQGLMDKAQEIVQIMIANGFPPDIFTYCILINGYSKLKRMDAVMALLREMWQKGLSPNTVTYSTLIDMLCKKGKIKEVEKIMKMMIDRKQDPDTVTYTTLIQVYCSHGLIDKAQETFETMVSKGCAPDVFAYNILIQGYCKLRRWDDVIALLKEMSQKGLSPNPFTYSLIDILSKGGKTKEAESIMKLMIDIKQRGE